ncbi:MAG: SGNH/GDSL hydrolase family protein [Wenzhouxiangella sp.]
MSFWLSRMQVLFWLGFVLLLPQALWVRRRARRFADAAGDPAGRVPGPDPVRLIAIGDSIIAGVGCRTLEQACVGQTAVCLAERLDRGVEWTSLGQTGATTAAVLYRLVPRLPAAPADYLLISVGVNDITGLKSIDSWRERLAALIDALHRHSPGARIVLLGVPPLQCFPRLPQPLRALFGLRARAFDRAAAQVFASRPCAVYVPFDQKLSPEQFAPDGYHPSEASCRELAGVLVDALLGRNR